MNSPAMRLVTGFTFSIVVVAMNSPVAAQNPTPPLRVWMAAGLGPGGSSDGAGGAAGTLQLSAMRAPHQVTLRVAGATPIFYPGATADEISVLYSRVLRGSAGHLSAGAGLGITSRDPCNGDGPECATSRVVALPLSAEAALRILPVFGLGLHVFANLSEFGYMGGFALVAQVGWFPK